jgi:hypothetical protein
MVTAKLIVGIACQYTSVESGWVGHSNSVLLHVSQHCCTLIFFVLRYCFHVPVGNMLSSKSPVARCCGGQLLINLVLQLRVISLFEEEEI